MTIEILEKTEGCLPQIIKKGEWIDLYASEDVILRGPYAETLKRKTKDGKIIEKTRKVVFDYKLIPLGVAMRLPKGCEAIIAPRSSTFKRHFVMEGNNMGIVDNSYSGNNDEWRFPAVAFADTTIPKGTRICQFRVQLSQKATVWQKIKWLFSNEVKIRKVDHLDDEDRQGFGSTGTN